MAETKKQKTFKIEGARLLFRNFEGKESKYNRKGDRNFCVVIPLEDVEGMRKVGWNPKILEPREDGDEPLAYISVNVNFSYKPPNIVVISSAGRTKLNEETCGMLDIVNFENVDLICRGYDYVVNDKSGTKAYLQTIYATIEEDELDRKYAKAGPLTVAESHDDDA